MKNPNAQIVIIGAGPAGLTAALELQAQGFSDITVLESGSQVGGISRTVNYHGNRIDIGGHRFFSKSDWVMQWWAKILPLQNPGSIEGRTFSYQGQRWEQFPDLPTTNEDTDEVLLVRSRLSRIYFNNQFFDYPLKLNVETLRKLGFKKTVSFGWSFMLAKLRPVKPERSLEDFLINRFGRKLYLQFFKEYTEKVWGVPCGEISAEWGAQRIKSLSILSAISHAVKKLLGIGNKTATNTSLIESFIYPKYGPGQMWESAARKFTEGGGRLHFGQTAEKLGMDGERVTSVAAVDSAGVTHAYAADVVISTMPIKDLCASLPESWDPQAKAIAANLQYRDFITVGLLYKKQDLTHDLQDNWIYIQEPGVNVGRVQIFNNWSPFMVAEAGNIWMGLEFFCKESDALWKMSDHDMIALAEKEMRSIGLVRVDESLDAMVLRVPKAYPGYFGEAYQKFDTLRAALDRIPNLFLVGRNGMHRYNNQDHSMLTAKAAVELIQTGSLDRDRIWAINVDDEYHEEKK